MLHLARNFPIVMFWIYPQVCLYLLTNSVGSVGYSICFSISVSYGAVNTTLVWVISVTSPLT